MKTGKIVLIVIMVLITNTLGFAYARVDKEPYKVALLLWGGPDGFKAKMSELGYVEGQDVTYLYTDMTDVAMENYQAEYEKQVKAMVDGGVDMFVTETDTDAVNLRVLVGTEIPIVFARADDPVASGAVADLVTPGGNITGTITNRPHERRLQLLAEIKPTTKKVYYIISSYALASQETLQQVQAVAADLGIEIVPMTYTGQDDSWQEVVKNMPEDTDWVFFTPFVFLSAEQTAELAAISAERKIGWAYIIDQPVQGYLISYGPSISASSGQAAEAVDRILRGASPADLPVQTAENYLTINLEAAAAIDITVPESILRQANTIIRPGYFESLATPTPSN
jgi:putative ABC transport system substrate-binding protein